MTLDPMAEASSAGAASSSWLKVGDGQWRGNVTDETGRVFEVHELSSGDWVGTGGDGKQVKLKELGAVIHRLLGTSVTKRGGRRASSAPAAQSDGDVESGLQ